jgi:hypothetical protein
MASRHRLSQHKTSSMHKLLSSRHLTLATLAATLLIAASSCKRNEAIDGEDTGYATDNALVERTYSDVQNIADQAAETNSLSTYRMTGGGATPLSGCAVITHDTVSSPHKLTIDFGSTNCLCADGNYRRGQIIVSYAGRYRDANHQHDISFSNYFVNDNEVTGSKTVLRVADDAAGHPVYNITVNGKIILANSAGSISHTSMKSRTWAAGYNTPAWADDEYDISGSGSITRASGRVFSYQITTPLHMTLSCRWIQSGVVSITPQGASARTLDYGSGACDAQANYTVNGKTYSISLH